MSYSILDLLCLLGAVGLFLYGMKVMSEGLQKAAGDRLNSAMTQAVNVVPTLAPMITAMDCVRVIRPALTKLTTITVDADEDWINAVIRKPVMVPVRRLRVMAPRMFRRRSPAAFCRPSLITFIPYRNKPVHGP